MIIQSINAKGQEFLRRESNVQRVMSLSSVEDKRSREQLFVGELYLAAQYLNFPDKASDLTIDGDGFLSLQGFIPDRLYHSTASLKAMDAIKVLNTQYPSPDGDDLWNNDKVWEAARMVCRLPGRMIPLMMKKILEVIGEEFDMSKYAHREEDGFFAPLKAIGRWYLDGVNLCVTEIDNIREELMTLSRSNPRSFDEVEKLLENLKWTIRALEKGQAKQKGEEEGQVLKTFFRIQMIQENAVPFPNEAIRAATNDMMVKAAKELEVDVTRIKLESIKSEWLRIWRRTASAARSLGIAGPQMEQGYMTAERQVARAASTDQIRAEARSKEAAQMRPGMDELAVMRKELMDVKSQMNQIYWRTINCERRAQSTAPEGIRAVVDTKAMAEEGTTMEDGQKRIADTHTSREEEQGLPDPGWRRSRRRWRKRKKKASTYETLDGRMPQRMEERDADGRDGSESRRQ